MRVTTAAAAAGRVCQQSTLNGQRCHSQFTVPTHQPVM